MVALREAEVTQKTTREQPEKATHWRRAWRLDSVRQRHPRQDSPYPKDPGHHRSCPAQAPKERLHLFNFGILGALRPISSSRHHTDQSSRGESKHRAVPAARNAPLKICHKFIIANILIFLSNMYPFKQYFNLRKLTMWIVYVEFILFFLLQTWHWIRSLGIRSGSQRPRQFSLTRL